MDTHTRIHKLFKMGSLQLESFRIQCNELAGVGVGAKRQRNMGYISSNQEHNMCQQLSSLFGGIYMLFPGKHTLRKISATFGYDCGIEEVFFGGRWSASSQNKERIFPSLFILLKKQ